MLLYYDENKPLTLSVDSSEDGLGAVLFQDGLPLAYASKSLTETQKQYAQIEKETLAILYGCQKCHQYLYGKHFEIESDHKPLETIFKKPLEQCPLRLQRLRINLQNYDFMIRYTPDALSRMIGRDENFPLLDKELKLHVDLLNYYCKISEQQFNGLEQKTAKDSELIKLSKAIREGWPTDKKKRHPLIQPYWKIKDELVN